MGANSAIQWTDHTFNPWIGCCKVSPGCERCYAMTMDHRFGHNNWGPAKTTDRRVMSDNYWRQPLKWNAAAAKSNKRRRVFCASMADVFEEHPEVTDTRLRLFNLIDETPNLDWQLLTKRPENINQMIPLDWRAHPRKNVWYGTSVEDQQRADERIEKLLQVNAWVRFLSCEPMLGPVRLPSLATPWKGWRRCGGPGIHWVICGGESGHGARPMHPDWARSLRDQCQEAGVAYHFKQWGAWRPIDHMSADEHDAMYRPIPEDEPMGLARCKVATQAIQFNGGSGYQSFDGHCGYLTFNVGKHAAGRLLDGREWNELPI